MKHLILGFLICSISVSYSQSLKYDSIKKQYNYFNATYKFIGYSKKVGSETKAYDFNNNEVPIDYLFHHMNTKDDGSDYTMGDAAKSIGWDITPKPVEKKTTEEYKMPEKHIISSKWNDVFKRWDYIYGY